MDADYDILLHNLVQETMPTLKYAYALSKVSKENVFIITIVISSL